MRDIVEQVDSHAQVQTSCCNATYQHLQKVQRDAKSIQPLLSSVGHELAELEVAGLPKNELQTVQGAFETYRQRLAT